MKEITGMVLIFFLLALIVIRGIRGLNLISVPTLPSSIKLLRRETFDYYDG